MLLPYYLKPDEMRIKNGYKIRNIAGESVIVSIGTLNVNLTKVISLNPTSVWLWEQLGNEDFDADKVADRLVEKDEIDRTTARSDAKVWTEAIKKADRHEE